MSASQAGGADDGVTRSSRDFFTSVIVHADQIGPAALGVVAHGSFLLQELEAVLLQQSDKLTESHAQRL